MISAAASFDSANAALAKRPFIVFEIDGYSRIFCSATTGFASQNAWLVKCSDIEFSVDSLEGTCELGDVTVTVLDYQNLLTTDMAGITLEGRTCRIKTGFPGQPYVDFLTIFTGRVDTIPSSESNNCYDFVCKDTRLDMVKVIYLTGDDGAPTDGDHPKTILANPIDIILDVLVNQLSISPSDIDLATFNSYKDEQFAGLFFDFVITSPPEGKAFLESQIFKPLGGYLRSNNLGKITPHFFIPLAGTAVSQMTLDKNKLVDLPEMGQSDLINVVSFRFDKNNDNFVTEAVRKYAISISKYGQQGQHIVEADGLRAAFQGFFIAAQTANAIFTRFGNKNPRMDVKVLWDSCKLEPGDIVAVTMALLPNRAAGTMGITNKLFEIENFKLNMTDFVVEMTLVDASGIASYGRYRIAPDPKVAWTLATSGDKARYMYVADSTGKYSDATPGNTLA